ncbi:MAG: AmmeMemoRadiSam system protein B [Campylobacterales bacterium]|nr:AmmeMemoRadiSam system protein B [Campylobacterales bacterium]MBN2832083.1 AmmeMemoRadiSam system protein B [Campylobacterales bacterium]
MKTRKSAVAGMFYPERCHDIKAFITHFESQIKGPTCTIAPKALIVPHAGYIYSGYTANLAYHYTASKRSDIQCVVVIGPSHRVYLEGASIALYDTYHTPCGEISIDLAFSHMLEKQFSFLRFHPTAHEEHSTEVQMPFIRHYFKEAMVVEIVYGDITAKELSDVMDTVLTEENTLLVVSTDLSHFHSEEEANELDNICIQAIQNLDIHALSNGCEACGILGIKALVHVAEKHHLKPHFLDYRTSFAHTKDASRVVGYTSFVLG